MYYTLKGKTPVKVASVTEWGQWMESHAETRQLANNMIGKCRVSTVFLGVDHSLSRDDEPVLFETMVFCEGRKHRHDQEQERYHTFDDAMEGHEAMIGGR